MAESKPEARCGDCGMDYGDFPLDVHIPNVYWNEIAPSDDGGGLLCPNCICKALAKLGATCLWACPVNVA